MSSRRPYVSIIIPTFNERRNIARVIRGVRSVMDGRSYELIVVDGNSADGTAGVARSMGARVLTESTGKGYALRKGFAAARGSIIVSMDADMSHRPKELLLLISAIESGYDVCMGSRFIAGGGSEDMPMYRRLGNKVFIMLVNMLYHAHYTDLCYGYRSMTSEALKRLHLKSDGFGIETEINIKTRQAGLKVVEVPSYEKRRQAGEGKLRSVRDGYIILRTIFENLR